MEIELYGAASGVTGSCHILRTGDHRVLLDCDRVRIHGEEYRVQARIHTVGGLSAHADQGDLMRWLSGFRNRPRIALVHGEDEAKLALRTALREHMGIDAMTPSPGDIIDLLA